MDIVGILEERSNLKMSSIILQNNQEKQKKETINKNGNLCKKPVFDEISFI